MPSQHIWTEKDDEGRKREVRATKFGGKWRLQAKTAGEVRVGEQVVQKPAAMIDIAAPIAIAEAPQFVGRGALKLAGALDYFKIVAQGIIALDIGASTGGFTDCLLQRGAAKVFAV